MIPPSDIVILGWNIHLYSVFFAAGSLAAFFVARWAAKQFGIEESRFDSLALITFISGFAGARLFFVIGYLDEFIGNPSAIFRFWDGGLAFYGGVIGSL